MSDDSKTATDNRLAIPIYLNQRIVFDLLAIVENGFSDLRTIRTTEQGGESKKQDVGAEVGVTNVFAFLGIGVKGSRQKEESSSSQRETAEEKVYTPTALFSRLRDVLVEQKRINFIDSLSTVSKVELGQFVEFRAQLRKNPLLDAIDGMNQTADLIKAFDPGRPKQKGENKDREKAEALRMFDQLRKMFDVITQARTLDLIAQLPHAQVVVPVDLEFFERQSPAAIIDGQFRVIGKVVRTIGEGGGESINLLRGTQLSRLPEEFLTQMKNAFEEFRGLGFGISQIITTVPGPAFQVVPIAIFA